MKGIKPRSGDIMVAGGAENGCDEMNHSNKTA